MNTKWLLQFAVLLFARGAAEVDSTTGAGDETVRRFKHCGAGKCLHEAAYTSNLLAVQDILAHDVERVDSRRSGGRTALHRVGYDAATRGDGTAAAIVARELLNAGADANARDKFWFTPLMMAASSGLAGVARVLLESGAHCSHDKKDRRTPLMLASLHGHVDVVRLLLVHCGSDRGGGGSGGGGDGAPAPAFSVSQYDVHGWTALHLAIANVHKDAPTWAKIVRLLLDHGAEVDAVDAHGRTPLMYAAHTGSAAIVAVLLRHNASVEAHDTESRTPLTWAQLGQSSGREHVMEMLREAAVQRALDRHRLWLEQSDELDARRDDVREL